MMKLLVTTPLHFIPLVKDEFCGIADCVFVGEHTKENIIDMISDFDGWVCQPCPEYKIDDEILAVALKLKFIASASTGTNHIDVGLCEELNIKVMCLKGAKDVREIVASSEFTFGLMLAVTRQIPQSFGNAKTGRWREDEDIFRGIELRGKTLGIIGYGRIGSNNARYARSFGMRVWAYDPYVIIPDLDVVQRDSPYDVIENSDILMICVHLDESTRGMVNDYWFDRMKDGVYFINTSRGEVVDEDALLENLKSGKVAAAGLDVISGELTEDKNAHPIIEYARNNSNLIVTPHIAGLTYESETKAARIIIKQIKELI
jgi:phosphoglycerate dehydrogenase-like enzyme